MNKIHWKNWQFNYKHFNRKLFSYKIKRVVSGRKWTERQSWSIGQCSVIMSTFSGLLSSGLIFRFVVRGVGDVRCYWLKLAKYLGIFFWLWSKLVYSNKWEECQTWKDWRILSCRVCKNTVSNICYTTL